MEPEQLLAEAERVIERLVEQVDAWEAAIDYIGGEQSDEVHRLWVADYEPLLRADDWLLTYRRYLAYRPSKKGLP